MYNKFCASTRALSLLGKSITPRGNRTISPSSVARFNSVSVIAPGFVKLLFKSVMSACKSGRPNESTNSCADGIAAGEGDDMAGDLDGIAVALEALEDGAT